jgi:hypothetical protein
MRGREGQAWHANCDGKTGTLARSRFINEPEPSYNSIGPCLFLNAMGLGSRDQPKGNKRSNHCKRSPGGSLVSGGLQRPHEIIRLRARREPEAVHFIGGQNSAEGVAKLGFGRRLLQQFVRL